MKKIRIAAIIVLIVAGVVALYSAISGGSHFTRASGSIETLHDDRLVAANYLFQANDLVHSKRVLLERLEMVNSVTVAEESMNLTPRLKALIADYGTTRMTGEEQALLKTLGELTREMENIERDQLYSYQVRDRLRFLSAEALASLKALAAIQLREGGIAASTAQAEVSTGVVSGNLIAAIFVIGMIGLIFVFTRLSRRSGLGRPFVRYLNSLM